MIPLRLVIDTNVLVSAALKPDGLQCAILRIRRGLRQKLVRFIGIVAPHLIA
jgi:predicted nucleic acid-binding protein